MHVCRQLEGMGSALQDSMETSLRGTLLRTKVERSDMSTRTLQLYLRILRVADECSHHHRETCKTLNQRVSRTRIRTEAMRHTMHQILPRMHPLTLTSSVRVGKTILVRVASKS